MSEKNICDDAAILSQVNPTVIKKVHSLEEYLIGQYVYEAFIENAEEDLLKINLGYGELLIKREEGEIKTKFILSKALYKEMDNIFKGNESSLQLVTTESLKAKLMDFGKDLI